MWEFWNSGCDSKSIISSVLYLTEWALTALSSSPFSIFNLKWTCSFGTKIIEQDSLIKSVFDSSPNSEQIDLSKSWTNFWEFYSQSKNEYFLDKFLALVNDIQLFEIGSGLSESQTRAF